MYTLNQLKPGDTATVKEICTKNTLRRRLVDFGMTKGTCVCCVGKSPMGDPSAYLVRGAVIALRGEDAEQITVER